MKRISLPAFSFLFLMFFVAETFAQLDLPRLSPKASVMQIVGLSEVSISYGRPSVRGRKIWGELVPFNTVWRSGADEATTITFGDSVQINGQKLEAGKYSFFTIPNENEWTIIFNKVSKQWGAYNYDSTKDALRIKVKPQEHNFTESLQYNFTDLHTDFVKVNLDWENLRISFDVKVNVNHKAYQNIKKALSEVKSDDWITYAAAANYAADNKIHIDEAMSWIDKSISIKPGYYNYYVKSKLLFENGNKKEAKNFLQKSKEAGKTDPEFKSFESNIEKLESEINKK